MAGAADHAAWNDQPLAAGGLCRKRGADCLGAATVLPVLLQIDGTLAARVVVDLLRLGGKPWVLAIDRTNWDFGKTTINILMISVVWNGMGIPLIWMLLPTAGNSNTSERTGLLDRLRAAFPDLKIAALMGDREFIGDMWMALSTSRENPFHPASAREPVRPARGLRRHADFRHRAAAESARKNDCQRPLLARLPERDFVRVRAARGDANSVG